MRDRLLRSATALVLERGFAAASVGAICRDAGVTKGAFFHYWDTKEAMAADMLERYLSAVGASLEAAVGSVTDPVARVEAYFDEAIEMTRTPLLARGCLLGSLTQEVAQSRSALGAACGSCFAHWQQMLTGLLRDARAVAAPGAAWDPAEVAEHVVVVQQGAALIAKLSGPERMATHIEHARRYVRTLLREGAVG